MSDGGHLLVQCLQSQGVDNVFCVPGESYLAVLNALHGESIRVVNCRHESSATMMADAQGKLTGRPGVAMVTRGPGATNASAGVHIAQQDSTPLVLFVGQIGLDMDGRDAFQEIDYRLMFGSIAKWVTEIRSVERIPEIIAHAWSVAMSGRPGPVVIALPEDMLTSAVNKRPCKRTEVSKPAPNPDDLVTLKQRLEAAENPICILGGSRWSRESSLAMEEFSESWDLPVVCSFRRQMLFDHLHPNFVGELGLGVNPKLISRIRNSDLILLIGGRLSELPSQGYTLQSMGDFERLVHVHPGAEELERVYQSNLLINATPDMFLRMAPRGLSTGPSRCRSAHAEYLQWSTPLADGIGSLHMHFVSAFLEEHLPDDAVITNGAGNYTAWMQRFRRYREYGTQLGPISGSMGYGLPAAIAAKITQPTKPVICLAGDGCYQMNSQELATAVQEQTNILILVIDNGMYGTIRMHQERNYPGRVSATRLLNPDFAMQARAAGAFGETVTKNDEFQSVFERALTHDGPALLHLIIDPEGITPNISLSEMRATALAACAN